MCADWCILVTQDEVNSEPSKPSGSPRAAARFGRDLTTGSIPRHLIAFSLPMLAGSALQTAYSFVNAIWVGQYLGKNALAAVTVSFPVVFVLIALAAGMTLATTILVSQHYGARDMQALRRVVSSSTALIGALGLVMFIGGELLAGWILRAMDTPPEIWAIATSYLRIFLFSLPAVFGVFLVRGMLQGIGDSKTPLYFQSAGLLLSAALDPVLMFGWLGMPRLGLNGTAYATIIAQGLAVVSMVIWLRRSNSPVAPRAMRQFDWATTWITLRIGAPSAVQQSLISVGMVFVTSIINGFGGDATAAFGAASRVDQLAFMPAMTLSMAVSSLAGQNIGAGRYDRIRQVLLWGCLFSFGMTAVASLLAVSVPTTLLHIFTRDPAVVDIGRSYLRTVGASYCFFAVMFITNGIINGSGHTLVPTLISLVSLWVVRVPLAYWLSRKMGSIQGVWYSMALSFFVSMVASAAYYYTGRWRRPIMRRSSPPPPNTPEAVFGEETGEA